MLKSEKLYAVSEEQFFVQINNLVLCLQRFLFAANSAKLLLFKFFFLSDRACSGFKQLAVPFKWVNNNFLSFSGRENLQHVSFRFDVFFSSHFVGINGEATGLELG